MYAGESPRIGLRPDRCESLLDTGPVRPLIPGPCLNKRLSSLHEAAERTASWFDTPSSSRIQYTENRIYVLAYPDPMPPPVPPTNSLTARDILLLAAIVSAGVLILTVLVSLSTCLLSCPLVPLRH